MFSLNSDILKNYANNFLPNNYPVFLAGSFVLNHYIRNDLNIQPEWEPGDMDLWVSIPNLILNDDYNIKKYNKESITDLINLTNEYFINCGFINYNPPFIKRFEYNNLKSISYKYLINVLYFEKDNQKLQIIFISKINNIQTFINTFDISVCSIAWDIRQQNYIVDNIVRQGIEKNIMWKQTHGTLQRFFKYKKRGFNFIEENLPAFNIINSQFPKVLQEKYLYHSNRGVPINIDLTKGIFLELNNNITLFMFQRDNIKYFYKYSDNNQTPVNLENITEYKIYNENEFKFIFHQYIIKKIYILIIKPEKTENKNNNLVDYTEISNIKLFITLFDREKYKISLLKKIIKRSKIYIQIICHPVRLFNQGYFHIDEIIENKLLFNKEIDEIKTEEEEDEIKTEDKEIKTENKEIQQFNKSSSLLSIKFNNKININKVIILGVNLFIILSGSIFSKKKS
jgi:hypothetical protein